MHEGGRASLASETERSGRPYIAAMPETYTITLLPMGEMLLCAPEETVLAAILRSGGRVHYGCTGGGCGVCKMRLIAGHLDYGRYSVGALSEEERQNGFFLSCQAKPLSDLTIQLTGANRYRRAATFFGESSRPR
jgi:ferredoxin